MSHRTNRKTIDGITPSTGHKSHNLSPAVSNSVRVHVRPAKQFSEVIDVSRPLRVAKNHESRLVFYSRLAAQGSIGSHRPQRARLKHAVSIESLSRLTFAHDLATGTQRSTGLNNDLGTVQRLRKSYRHHKTNRRIKRLKTGRMLSKRI